MQIPERVTRQEGRRALVDGIPFELPVVCAPSPVMMAAFTIDLQKAAAVLPGRELFPLKLPNDRGILVIAVIACAVRLGLSATANPLKPKPGLAPK